MRQTQYGYADEQHSSTTIQWSTVKNFSNVREGGAIPEQNLISLPSPKKQQTV